MRVSLPILREREGCGGHSHLPTRPPLFEHAPRHDLDHAVAVYRLGTALIYIIFLLAEGWEAWQRSLLLAPLMVVSLAYVVIPTIQARFGRFIATGKR